MRPAIDIDDLKRYAQRRLPRMIFDYLEGGADDEAGLRSNREAFDRIKLLPQRLVDVTQREQSISLFESSLRSPMVIAPTGLNGLLWPDGDIALARAAVHCGIPFSLSTASNATLEEVADQAGGDLWFQLYVVRRQLAEHLVKRAMNAGYRTLILTVDVAINGKRKRDIRNNFSLPFQYTPRVIADLMSHPRWLCGLLGGGMPQMRNLQSSAAGDITAQAALIQRDMDASFNWDDLRHLRSIWPHRLLIKGILSAPDAKHCVDLGADGIILSNHGGRQLTGLCTPVEMLPVVAQTVSQPILIDSGIRSGIDVVKSLAMGATAVLLGRAVLYGLAAGGESGAIDAIQLIQEDIDRSLALLGCTQVVQLNQQFVWPA